MPRESLAEAFARLEEAGVGPERAREAARHLSLELVLTAHPTEATRRTCSPRTSGSSRLLHALDDPALSPAARAGVEAALAEEVTLLWQTDEVRSQRPRVVDEIRHGLWFFEQSLLDVAPRLVADAPRARSRAPAPLRFGTWIGGDQDGNPAAGPETIARRSSVAASSRSPRTGTRCASSRARSGSRPGRSGVSPELLESIARDERELPAYAAELGGSQPGRALPAQAQLRLAAPCQRARGRR